MEENPWILAARGELPEEELDPELAPFQSVEPPFGLMIKHPLVFSPVHHPRLNAAINWALREKKAQRARYADGGDWRGYVFCHERPYRLDAFAEVTAEIPDHLYWPILGDIYTDSENIWQREDLWREALTCNRPGRELLMEPPERRALAQLPEDLAVYRGFCVTGRERGLSWTTERHTAAWFAARLAMDGQTPRVAEGRTARDRVIAYFTGRGESELLILPETVQDMIITRP